MAEFQFARPDFSRHERKGVPEVILAERKDLDQILEITRRFLEVKGRAILSRVPLEMATRLRVEFDTFDTKWHPVPRAMVIRRPDTAPPNSGGRVGILSAGTSDVPIAEEAAILCREMGCEVHTAYDVGVAGLHRLFKPLEHMLNQVQVDAIIVAAGMDGALPSVVSGLVDVPVIGLPTSVGYGLGGQGVAALLTMIQSCAPGMAVVNIDNGVGAAAIAGLIANRAAAARRESSANT